MGKLMEKKAWASELWSAVAVISALVMMSLALQLVMGMGPKGYLFIVGILFMAMKYIVYMVVI